MGGSRPLKTFKGLLDAIWTATIMVVSKLVVGMNEKAHVSQFRASWAGRGSKLEIANLICNRTADMLEVFDEHARSQHHKGIPVTW
jgi:hypothetical protein